MNLDSIIAIAYVYSVTATCCDFTLGLLPVFLIWKLQMNTRTKVALAAILGLGCVYVFFHSLVYIPAYSFPRSASAAVIIRIPFLHDYKDKDFLCEFQSLICQILYPIPIVDRSLTPNLPDATANISIWSNVEAGLGIAAGSLVTLRPLFNWFRDPSSAGESRSKGKRTSVPLSSVNGVKSHTSDTRYWRPDLEDDSHAVITTVHTSNQASRTSSQEELHPRNGTYFQGVNVQKTFYVSADQAP